MDFVVSGFGLGALLILLGYAVRGLGPRSRRVSHDRLLPWSDLAHRIAWGRHCRATGTMLTLIGGSLWFATCVALLGQANDALGNQLMGGVLLLSAIGFVAWTIAYARRQPPLRRKWQPLATSLATTSPHHEGAGSVFDNDHLASANGIAARSAEIVPTRAAVAGDDPSLDSPREERPTESIAVMVSTAAVEPLSLDGLDEPSTSLPATTLEPVQPVEPVEPIEEVVPAEDPPENGESPVGEEPVAVNCTAARVQRGA